MHYFLSHSCTSSASDSPEGQSKLLERQSSTALVSTAKPPSLLCCFVFMLFIWCSLDENSGFSRYVCIIWHISSASSTWGCWVTLKSFLWSAGLEHGEISPFIIQHYICCKSWVIQQLYIFPVKCGIPPVLSYSLTLYCWNKSSFLCFKVFLGGGRTGWLASFPTLSYLHAHCSLLICCLEWAVTPLAILCGALKPEILPFSLTAILKND